MEEDEMGTTMGTGNVHNDDEETLQFADEAEDYDDYSDDDLSPPSERDYGDRGDLLDLLRKNIRAESVLEVIAYVEQWRTDNLSEDATPESYLDAVEDVLTTIRELQI